MFVIQNLYENVDGGYFRIIFFMYIFLYSWNVYNFLFFLRFYLFIFREWGREGERKRNINVWLPLIRPPLGT